MSKWLVIKRMINTLNKWSMVKWIIEFMNKGIESLPQTLLF